MKKIYMILAAMTLLSMSLNAQIDTSKKGVVKPTTTTEKGVTSITTRANTPNGPSSAPMRGTGQFIVCDGTSTSPYLPFYGLYFDDNYQISQMIYPESLLTDLVGKEITSITFHANNTISSDLNTGRFTFKIGTTSQTTFGSTVTRITTGMTTVATGMLMSSCISGSQFVIDFSDNPFTYQGGNLVLDYQLTTLASGYKTTNFFGENNHNNASFYSRSTSNSPNSSTGVYSNTTRASFLPKVTFTYESESHDLAIALSAPATAGAGTTVDVTATVTNNGDFVENGYTVTFTANGTTIATQTGGTLAQGASATFTTTYTTDADAGTVNFGANVACTDDAVADNNTATASTLILNCPPPENVAATATGNTGTMTWDAPILTASAITESFEDTSLYPEFSLGGITATQHTGSIGDWTLYDSTGSDVYGYESITVPNLGDPQAWMVFAPGSSQLSQSLTDTQAAYNGNQMMASFCPGSNTIASDHWLISPLLSGDAQTISFYARELTDQYGAETFEVLYSTTDNNPASFSRAESFSSTSTDWAQFTAQLPANAKYFAIRHTSTDVFALFVDDITYIPAPEPPVSYNVYLDGELKGNVDANTFSYDFSNVSVGEHTCAVSAVYSYGESVAVPATFTTQPQTEAPVISYETVGDNVVITTTGNGTVTLNIPGYPAATGTGSASITVPRHMEDYTVTATATAQEADHLISETTTEQVLIPGIASEQGWLQMDGSYTTGGQQLSFTRGNNPILFVDQFTAETQNNEHPDHYDYCLSEDVENDAKTSSTIPIPVHKTYSTLQGLYTKAEVDNDALNTPREITANAVNGTMAYDIKAGSEVYFYGLYRGALDANPVIDDSHRISMIQKDLNEAFFNENMTNDVEPKYSHIEAGDIKRVDKDFVTGNNSNTMSYVPVIWTYGDHTGRPAATGNNSYGSDIKRMKIGDVTARIEGTKSDGNSWGKWKVGETEYCVYTPVISITGIMPVDIPQGDGDYATYEPYMFRAWCTYDKAYDFGHDADGHLVGGDLIPAPFLLDSVLLEPNQKEYVLGGEWNGETRMPWAFGVEVGENPANITFLIRFYYKKVVTDAQQSSKLMGNRDGEGAEEYFAVQCEGDAQGIVTAINEILNGRIPIETTYVNAQGMTSNKPFDGLNIVVTRYSDGSTTTTKVVR